MSLVDLASAPPPPRPPGAEAPDQQPDTPFASVLEDQARPAAAEGLSKQDAPDAPARPIASPYAHGGSRRAHGTTGPRRERALDDVAGADAAAGGAAPLAGTLTGTTATASAPVGAAAPAPTLQAGATAPPLGAPAPTAPVAAAQRAAGFVPQVVQPLASVAAPVPSGAGSPLGVGFGAAVGVAQPSPTVASAAKPDGPPLTADAPVPAGAPAQPPGAQAGAGTLAQPIAHAPNGQPTGATHATSARPAPAAAGVSAPARQAGSDGRAGDGSPADAGRGRTASGSPATAHAPSGAAAASAGAAASDAVAASSTAAAPVVAQPAAATAPGFAAPQPAVGLDRAVETVRLAVRAAAERGIAQARISLSPAQLGSIEIHLRHTAAGLLARIVAQHGAAAQLLQQAGDELRRSLESQGLTLLRLDVGASGQQASGGAGEQRGDGGPAARAADRGEPDAGDVQADPAAPATVTLPNGVLIDVLA